MSFPKGGLKSVDGNSILVAAKREWSEETGLSLSRVRLLHGAYLDEPQTGSRYLLAQCEPPHLGSGDPDASRMAWNPPLEDPQDKNPIVRSQWLLVEDVVRGRSALGRDRVVFLEKAVELLRAGGNFIAAAPGSASASDGEQREKYIAQVCREYSDIYERSKAAASKRRYDE